MKMRKEPWSDTENNILLEYYYKLNLGTIVSLLPDRNYKEIRDQVFLLGRKNKTFEF